MAGLCGTWCQLCTGPARTEVSLSLPGLTRQSISFDRSPCEDGWMPGSSRSSPGMTTPETDTRPRSRGAKTPGLCKKPCPSDSRGRRECRAPDAPAVSCAKIVVERTRAYRSHRNHPAFPAQWFTAYIALSPELGLFGLRRPWNCFRELGASVEASGPHDFTVRIKCPRQKHYPRPPHPAPRS